MSYFINSLSFYFLLPAYVALALLLTFFYIPEDFYFGIFIFFAIVTLPVLLSTIFVPRMRMKDYYHSMSTNPRYRLSILSLCFLIVLCGPIDIYVNGFKLLNPASYADLHGIGRYVRHITILCWIFIPVAFIFLRSRRLMKISFISYAILFPILIIDRNRFFISCYSLLLCLILSYDLPRLKKSWTFGKLLLCVLPIVSILIFSLIGHFRSGSSFIVPSSGTFLQENALPLVDSFASLPSLLQQVILYITTPLFNFATIVSQDFINQDFLLSQFSPFNRESFDAYPFAPVLVPRFNVGTEFYPFLLFGGLSMVAWAFVLMLLGFIAAFYLFRKCPNIFTFLIFLKISYSALFMGFAPQFYILLNLMFVVLMMFLWFFSELLRSSVVHEKIMEHQF